MLNNRTQTEWLLQIIEGTLRANGVELFYATTKLPVVEADRRHALNTALFRAVYPSALTHLDEKRERQSS